jgi:polyisoprenoid-binding protein YceI
MKSRIFGFVLIAVLATAACASLIAPKVLSEPAALKPGTYALDPEHTAVLFKVNHLGFANFVGRFEKLEATLDFDDADPKLSHVEAKIDIASLDVANDEFAATLTGPDWLDAGRFPEAVFRSTRIETTAANSGRMAGDLTLHGVTSPVALDVTFNGGARDLLRGGYAVGFSAKGVFSRKAFGVDRFDGVVGDAVVIEIEAEFVRR